MSNGNGLESLGGSHERKLPFVDVSKRGFLDSNSVQVSIGKEGVSILNPNGNGSFQDHVQVTVANGVLQISNNSRM